MQTLISDDFDVPVRQRLPLSEAQQGLEMYQENMSANKILLVADPRAVPL